MQVPKVARGKSSLVSTFPLFAFSIFNNKLPVELAEMVRIVPSPDWFCGVDGVDLCVNSEWIDGLTLEVRKGLRFL